MQTLTSEQLAWVKQGKTIKTLMTITPQVGDPMEVDYLHDIVEDSFSLDRNSAVGKDIEIGCADAAELKFELYRGTKYQNLVLEGSQIDLEFEIAGATIPGGVFTIDEKPAIGEILRICALDNMIKFSQPFVSAVPYPRTLGDILNECCTICGVTNGVGTFPNMNLSITKRPDTTETTHQQMVSFIAAMAGRNAYVDEAGILRFRWYGSDPVLSLENSDYWEIEFAENNQQITGLVCLDKSGVRRLAGEEGYVLDLTGNPFLDRDTQARLASILTQIGSTVWRPVYRLDAIMLPHVWPGDQLQIETDSGTISTIVTNHLMTSGSNIAAAGKPETAKQYASLPSFTAKEQREIIEVIYTRKLVADSILVPGADESPDDVLTNVLTEIKGGKITLSSQTVMEPEVQESLQGVPGADGQPTYTWIKYADSPTSGMSDSPDGKAYIGIAHNKTTATESTNYSDYQWSLIKGADGEPFVWNIYTGSKDFSGSWSGLHYWTDGEPYGDFAVKERANKWGGMYQSLPMQTGDIVTISFFAKVELGSTIMSVHKNIALPGNVSTGLSIIGGNFSNITPYWVRPQQNGTEWKRYWATLEATQDDVILSWRIENSVDLKKLSICGLTLQRGAWSGMEAPSWSPHPDDLIGDTGTGISSVTIEYAIGGTTAPSSGWSTTPPTTWGDTQYLWTRNKITYTDSTVAYAGTNRLSDVEAERALEKAKDYADQIQVGGRNLAKRADLVASEVTLDLSNFSRGSFTIEKSIAYAGVKVKIGHLEPDTKYILHYKFKKLSGTLIKWGGAYDAGSIVSPAPAYYDGVLRWNYADPKNMTDDTAIHDVVVPFTTQNSVDPTHAIWIQPNRSDGTTIKAEIIELQLMRGTRVMDWQPAPEDVQQQIDDMVDIESTTVDYAASTSGTTAPSSGWQTSVPEVDRGAYLWTRTTFTYSDSTTRTVYSVSYMGADGTDGHSGINGLTPYVHIAYADDESGTGFSKSPANKSYIGVYTDYEPEDAAAGSELWQWSPLMDAQRYAELQTSYTNLEAGQASLGSRLGAYEEQLSLQPTEIAMKVMSGSELVPVMKLSGTRLSFLQDRAEISYFANQQMLIQRAEIIQQLKVGNHVAEKYGTEFTVWRYVGE